MSDARDQQPAMSQEALDQLIAALGTVSPPAAGVAKTLRFATGIPLLNVLVLAMLAGSVWAVGWVIPDHLKVIQTGYREVAVENAKQMESFVAGHKEGMLSLEKRQDERMKMALDQQREQWSQLQKSDDQRDASLRELIETEKSQVGELREMRSELKEVLRDRKGGT